MSSNPPSTPAPAASTPLISVETQILADSPFDVVINVSAPGMPVPNHDFQITLTPSGVVDSRYPNGVIPPIGPTLVWSAIPGDPNSAVGTPVTIHLASFLAATGGTPTYSIAGTLPPGWTLNPSTGDLSYSGAGVGSAHVQATATIGSLSVTSQSFPLQTFNPIAPDATGPTIPTGFVSTFAGATNQFQWDASCDPVKSGEAQTGVGGYIVTRDGNTNFATVASPGGAGLVNNFTYQDIGPVGAAGSAIQAANGVDWSISAAGTDIFSSPDAFGFLSASANGNATGIVNLIARLNGSTGTEPFAKSGLMFRLNNAVDSPFVLLTWQNGGFGVNLISRATQGGAPAQTGFAAPAFPIWFKLSWTLATNTFVASYSIDGDNWQAVGQVVVPMPPVILGGAAVCSHLAGNLQTAALAQFSMQNLPPVTYTDAAGGAHTYSVRAVDQKTPTANASLNTPSITTAAVPTGLSIRVGSGATQGMMIDQNSSAVHSIGGALIGPEEPWNFKNGTGTSAQGWGLVTATEYAAANAYGLNTLSAAAKPYGVLGHVREPVNSALYMAYTGLDPQLPSGSISNKYYSAGTDSAGNPLYCGGTGGGPGSGIGNETNGDPSVYRGNIMKAALNAKAANLYFIIDLHFSTPVLSSTGQKVLPIGQCPFLSTADLAFWVQVAQDFKNCPWVMFQLFNEPFGTNSGNATEMAYFGSQSLTPFDFPTSTTGTATTNLGGGATGVGYSMFDNAGDNGLHLIRGGGKLCKTVGFQQVILAIRAVLATNALIIGNQTYDQHPESYGQIGGPMVTSDTLVPPQLVADQHYTSAADSIYTALQNAGMPIVSTEMKVIPAASGGYTGWKTKKRWWTWWCWGNYATNGNSQGSPTGSPPGDPYQQGIMTTGLIGFTSIGGVLWADGTAPTGSN